jgi:hypothetical protein
MERKISRLDALCDFFLIYRDFFGSPQQWLRLTIIEVNQSADPTVTPAALVGGNPLGYVSVLEAGFCGLVLNADTTVKPETFNMDYECLDGMIAGLGCVASIASTLAGVTANIGDLLTRLEIENLVTVVGERIKDCCSCNINEVFFLIFG